MPGVLASAAASVLADHDRIAADLHQHVIEELSVTGIWLRGMVHASCGARPNSTVTVAAPTQRTAPVRPYPNKTHRGPHGGQPISLERSNCFARSGHDLTITGEDSAHGGEPC